MDEAKLRALERQYKLRVKTGCETCRIRRVKCDETKPECQRCTKTGRKCEGYKHVSPSRGQSPAAAASFRNPAFLVVPQKPSQPSIPRSLSRSLSPDAAENRSFCYFCTHTLPKWTEYFDSDLWSQKILQLSHSEPAIKHGVLALSTMHERFESVTSIFATKTNDFAFAQYMQAVRYSNDLLTAHRQGKVDVEKVLIACIIFTCYENLAGNYRAANMHLRNGLNILNQHKRELRPQAQSTAAQESIANVLYRFDLQAMTFSDETSFYEYNISNPPDFPYIPDEYTKNGPIRNDLVSLLRCMMWISGVLNVDPYATQNPTWCDMYSQVMDAFEKWETTFGKYQSMIPPNEQGDPKIYAGNTLLRIYAIITRIMMASGWGLETEMAWDAFADSFKTVVDLAETLPTLAQPSSPPASIRCPSSSPRPQTLTPRPLKHRPIAPNPSGSSTSTPAPQSTPSTPPGTSMLVFPSEPSPPARYKTPSESRGATLPVRKPSSFTPSFELSPIMPLFLTACRCRDPVTRRRAIALLFSSHRREGVWDSFGSAMVSLQCVKIEEDMDELCSIGADKWLPLSDIRTASEVTEARRVQDVFASVDMPRRHIAVKYLMRKGEVIDRNVRF
jgi:hypothetical protein